jgi:hypothetical protein
MKPTFVLVVFGLIAVGALFAAWGSESRRPEDHPRWRQHDVRRPRPAVVEPAEAPIATKPPRDAVVLFDGSSLDAWQAADGKPATWKLADGALEIVPGAGAIATKRRFGDMQLHVEWAAPSPPVGRGQDRGNSGVFLMDQFEIQVLDSYQSDTYADGQAGAIYGEFPPLFNASRPAGQWQSYDVAFRRPRFDAQGALLEPARVTLFHNGILVQNNEELFGPTSWLQWLPYEDRGDRGPISLQDHDHPVRFRNIWVREMPERPAAKPEDLAHPAVVTLPKERLGRFAGQYLLGEKPDSPRATIARENDHLVVSFPFRPGKLVLEPISETEFDMPHTDGRFTFHTDPDGRVTSVLFHIGDSDRNMKRIGE